MQGGRAPSSGRPSPPTKSTERHKFSLVPSCTTRSCSGRCVRISDPKGVLIQLEPLARGYVELGMLWGCDGATGVVAACLRAWAIEPRLSGEGTKSELGSVFHDDGVRYSARCDWMAEHVPDEPAWFLEIIGVDPRCEGLVSAPRSSLMASSGRKPTASPRPRDLGRRHVACYERFGFRAVEEGCTLGGPHVWFMRRDPVDLQSLGPPTSPCGR
jgi:hypothetical protein